MDEKEKEIKVIEGAKIKKKGRFEKFIETFIEDDLKSVLSWAAKDVLVPALKKMFVEFIDNTANSMVYGRSSKPYKSATSNISYREYYPPKNDYQPSWSSRADDIYSIGTVEVPDKQTAYEILDRMDAYINEYRFITVGYFMQMIKQQPRHTDFNYGWSSVRSAEVTPGRGGTWIIKLPKVMPLDR